MLPIPDCPVCGETERTIVCEYNRLIFLDSEWQSDLARYDYALCHGCGLVHPTRRPDRQEYEYLYAHFNEFLLREGRPYVFNVPELTPELMQDVDRQFVPWQELDTAPLKGFPIRRRLRRDLAAARTYLELITRHMPVAGARILHLRAKSSIFAAYARQAHGAGPADVVTLFPTHQYIAEKSPDIRVATSIDYHNFEIPFADKYDLILENHVLIHMLDPQQTFAVFRSHLQDGGAIFLRGELSDDELFRTKKNLFSELRPFHFNHFDRPTLARMFHRFGFDLVAVESGEGSDLIGLARLSGAERSCPRIPAAELSSRLDMYRRWRDESILSLPRQRAAALFGAELPAVWRRARRAGSLGFDPKGRLRALRPVGELRLPVEALEIGSVRNRRKDLLRWLGGRMRALPFGLKLAGWLSSVFPRSRLGLWLEHRVIGMARAAKPSKAAVPQI